MSADLHAPRAKATVRLALIGMLGLSMQGCVEAPTEDEPALPAPQEQRQPPQQAPTQPQQPPRRPQVGAPVAQRDATGGFFVAVNASGSGCPAGSWRSQISSDGQTFTMTFSSYEVSVDPTTAVGTKDCVLGLKLSSPRGLAFSLPTIYYGGYAFLEQGVRGQQSASYTFRGQSLRVGAPARQLSGPYDDAFLFEHGASSGNNRPWSPCGYDRVVNVSTQLRVQNSNPRRSGYMNLSAVDGQTKLVVQLAWRACQAPQAGADAASGARSAGVTTQSVDDEAWSVPTVSDAR